MKKSIIKLQQMKGSEQVTWITAYGYPMARAAMNAGVDMILVGDSGGMVELGYATTNPVTMDEMIQFAKAVRAGAPDVFIVGDMPQGSYEASNEDAVNNAMRFVKEAGCDSIKLEGGERMVERVQAITKAGIVVIGHLGLTPQSAASFGGYRVQGKTVDGYEALIKDSFALQKAGVSILLVEATPSEVGEQVTQHLNIPVYGIGAGNKLDGQLIIIHDLLGFYPTFRPWFAKCYVYEAVKKYMAEMEKQEDIKKYGIETRNDGISAIATLAIKDYVNEVKNKMFPTNEYIYPIKPEELVDVKKSKFWINMGV